MINGTYEGADADGYRLGANLPPVAVSRMTRTPQMYIPRGTRRIRHAVKDLILTDEAKFRTGQTPRTRIGVDPTTILGLLGAAHSPSLQWHFSTRPSRGDTASLRTIRHLRVTASSRRLDGFSCGHGGRC